MGERILAHNEKAAAMWSSGGHAYDEISRFIAEAIEHCVIRLAPKRGDRVLDVATGSGWTSRQVAKRGAGVTGIDIAEGMLTAAREIAVENGLDIEYRLADAEALPFADGHFDAVISTFGVMFAGGREAAASELSRVVRKGGRIALATWPPECNAVELRKVLGPYMTPPPSPPPSPFDWGRPEWLEETLGESFDLGFERGTAYHRVPDGTSAWEVFVAGFGPVRALAESLDTERRDAMRNDFIAFYDRFADGLGLSLPNDYLIAVGTRR